MSDTAEVKYISFEDGRVLTGRAAQQSLSSRVKKAKPEDKSAFWPVDARTQTRAQKRADERSRKRGQKRFVRRELVKEAAARDLANLFNIADGIVPGNRERAEAAIQARVDFVLAKDEERFLAALRNARPADRDSIPKLIPPDVARAQLRGLTVGVELPTPKGEVA